MMDQIAAGVISGMTNLNYFIVAGIIAVTNESSKESSKGE